MTITQEQVTEAGRVVFGHPSRIAEIRREIAALERERAKLEREIDDANELLRRAREQSA